MALLGAKVPCGTNNQDPVQSAGNGTGTYTVDDALDALEFGKYQTFLMFYLGLGWVADAMEVLLLSFLSPAVSGGKARAFKKPHDPLSKLCIATPDISPPRIVSERSIP